METLALELLQEIGLYLDPKSYHSLRKSFNTLLPFVQRVLPCYFDHPKVTELLKEFPRKDFKEYFRITQMNEELYWKLLDIHQYNLLVPFAHRVIEFDPEFYHFNKLNYAVRYVQSLYITRLFRNPSFVAEVSNLRELYHKY